MCLSRDIISVMAARSRWVILLLSCVIEFGHYYSLDTPASISNYLQVYMESVGGRSTVDFEYMYSMLYSCYCGPNLIMPVVAGFAIDRKGEAFVMGLFAICLPLGHIIFALGVMSAKWFLMMWGRAIVGVGAESVQMSLHVMLIRWFRGAEVTAAQGINLSVARMGSVLVAFMSPALCASAGINVAVLMGTIFSVTAFSATLVTVLCDRHFSKESVATRHGGSPMSLQQIKKLPFLYWLLTAVLVASYCSVIPFYNICASYFVKVKFPDVVLVRAQKMSTVAMSCMVLVTVIGIPPFAFVVDAVGKRTPMLCLSSVVVALTFAITSKGNIVVCMVLLGVAYTVFGTIVWAAFAQVVPPNQLGCAFGVATVLYNVGLTVTPAVLAFVESTAGWSWVIHFLQLFSIVTVGLTVSLMFFNWRLDGYLDWPSTTPKKFERDA